MQQEYQDCIGIVKRLSLYCDSIALLLGKPGKAWGALEPVGKQRPAQSFGSLAADISAMIADSIETWVCCGHRSRQRWTGADKRVQTMAAQHFLIPIECGKLAEHALECASLLAKELQLCGRMAAKVVRLAPCPVLTASGVPPRTS